MQYWYRSRPVNCLHKKTESFPGITDYINLTISVLKQTARLSTLNHRLYQVDNLYYVGGKTIQNIIKCINVLSHRTLKR